MKRVKAHLDMYESKLGIDSPHIISDWNGGTPRYIDFKVPGYFSFWFEYNDINYETGDITLSGVKDRTLQSGVRYILENYHYRYDGYIDYEMYDDGIPCNEQTLYLLIEEHDYDYRPQSTGGKGKQKHIVPYKVGAELKAELEDYNLKILRLRNERVDVLVNGKEHTVSLELPLVLGYSHAICLGRTEDQVYEFGYTFKIQLLRK